MLVLCKTKYQSLEMHKEVECTEWIMVDARRPSDVQPAWRKRVGELQRGWRIMRNPELKEYLPAHGKPSF